MTLAYFQYALHQLADPVGAIRSAWAAVRPGGWLLALDWYLPTDPDELRTRHAELIAGVQLDELIQGTRLVSRNEALGWFTDAGVERRVADRPAVGSDGDRRPARLTRGRRPPGGYLTSSDEVMFGWILQWKANVPGVL